MSEIATSETSIPQPKSKVDQALNRLDRFYTPEYIQQIHERNQHLWQELDVVRRESQTTEWINEIRTGMETVKGQSDHPHVSIIIPTHNEEKRLLQILQSIANQDYKGGIEVIVVDNNSSQNDKGAEFAERCGVRVIKYSLDKGKGFSQIAYARQKGLEAARGDIIISTDGDVIAPKEWVRLMAEPLDLNQNITAVAGGVAHYERGDKPRVTVSDILRAQTRPLKANQLNRREPEQITLYETRGVTPGANTAFRKADAMEISGYDTRIYPGEDTNIGLRLLKMGKIKYLKDTDATVRVSPRRYADVSLIEGIKRMIKRKADSDTMLYLDEHGNPVVKR